MRRTRRRCQTSCSSFSTTSTSSSSTSTITPRRQERVVHRGAVRGGSAHGADLVHRVGQQQHPGAVDGAKGRPQRRRAAARRRRHQRALRLRAQRERHERRRDRGRRPGRGPARGPSGRAPGVAHPPAEPDVVEGKLPRGELGDEHGARCLGEGAVGRGAVAVAAAVAASASAAGASAVASAATTTTTSSPSSPSGKDPVAPDRGAESGREAVDHHRVLDPKGDPVERAPVDARGELRVGPRGLLERQVLGQRHDGLERRVERPDPGRVDPHEPDGGDAAAAEQRGELEDRREGEGLVDVVVVFVAVFVSAAAAAVFAAAAFVVVVVLLGPARASEVGGEVKLPR